MKRKAMRNWIGRALLVLGLVGGASPSLSSESIIDLTPATVAENSGWTFSDAAPEFLYSTKYASNLTGASLVLEDVVCNAFDVYGKVGTYGGLMYGSVNVYVDGVFTTNLYFGSEVTESPALVGTIIVGLEAMAHTIEFVHDDSGRWVGLDFIVPAIIDYEEIIDLVPAIVAENNGWTFSDAAPGFLYSTKYAANVTGASLVLEDVVCNAFDVYGKVGTYDGLMYGAVDVYVDGVFNKNLYFGSEVTESPALVGTISGLEIQAHTIEFVHDDSGRWVGLDFIIARVVNGDVDMEGPVTQILSPTNGSEVAASFNITVATYDELSSIGSLYVLTNNAVYLMIQDPSAQETVSCDLPYGDHTIGAFAVDIHNNIGDTHTINVTRPEPQTGEFGVTIGVPADYAGREIRLRLDSETGPVIGSIVVESTGGWNNYALQETDLAQIPAGKHKLFLSFHGSSTAGNLKDIRVVKNGTRTPLFTGLDVVNFQGVTTNNGVIAGGGTGDWVEFPEYDFDTMSLVKEGGVVCAVTKTSSHSGYLEYLPPDYGSTTEDYPCIVFLHGFGERGNGLEPAVWSVATHGPFKHILQYDHTMTFTVGGKQESFIVIGPQSDAQGCMPPAEFKSVYDHILSAYRIDPDRVYLTGLSYGGQGSYEWAGSALNATNVIAAMGIMSATTAQGTAVTVGSRNIPIWAHHGDLDTTVHSYAAAINTINWINSANPIPAPIFTVYPNVGHSAWNQGYLTDHSLHNPNLYEWFLSHRLSD